MHLKIKQVFEVDTGEEVLFSSGVLIVEEGRNRQRWSSKLSDVKNGTLLETAMDDREKVELKFVSSKNEEFEGRVMVKNITSDRLGVLISLSGDGKLKGYD